MSDIFPNQRLQDLYNSYNQLLNFSGLCWWLIDVKDDPNVYYCNKVMCQTFSLDETVIKHSVAQTCPIAGDFNKNIAIRSSEKATKIFEDYSLLRKGEIEEYNNSFPYYDAKLDQTLYFQSRANILFKDEQGNAEILFGMIEEEKFSVELYKKAKTDGLTKLYNRREFDSQLTFLLNLAVREQHYVSLLICDIDHFKLYNDNLGHYAGDECLVTIAEIIAASCERQSEVVCRYGGEEFGIIVYGNAEQTALLAQKIRANVFNKAIHHPAFADKPVTVSIGHCTILPNASDNAKSLIEYADRALYKAKALGRNTCVGHPV